MGIFERTSLLHIPNDFYFLQFGFCYGYYLSFVDMVSWTMLLCDHTDKKLKTKILEMICYFRKHPQMRPGFCLVFLSKLNKGTSGIPLEYLIYLLFLSYCLRHF